MIIKSYRKYVSKEIRDKIYSAFLGAVLLFLRNFTENTKAKYKYLFRRLLPDTIALMEKRFLILAPPKPYFHWTPLNG
ncbi:MAG: hypothetical protein LBH19_07375 [Dysgonamonadaceae bacterium]|jgi:hypothetical protein|nr:hypothetical protein [Dysgonamonadaceae bacterium]